MFPHIERITNSGLFGERSEIIDWTIVEDFYIEVQSHNPKEINEGLLSLADELKIKAVAMVNIAESTFYNWMSRGMVERDRLATIPDAKPKPEEKIYLAVSLLI